ncbi:MAG: hypothetical protein ACLT2E_03570 [Alphaproteobacteria bacterium]
MIDYLQKNPQSMAAVLAVRLALNYKTCPPRLPERILRGGEIFKTALTAKRPAQPGKTAGRTGCP